MASSSDAEQPTAVGGYELVVGGDVDGTGGKVLGHRQFARYYRQKYRAGDPRHSIAINRVLAQCALVSPCVWFWTLSCSFITVQIAVVCSACQLFAQPCLTELDSIVGKPRGEGG